VSRVHPAHIDARLEYSYSIYEVLGQLDVAIAYFPVQYFCMMWCYITSPAAYIRSVQPQLWATLSSEKPSETVSVTCTLPRTEVANKTSLVTKH
jgi:hypothetical protein